MQVKIGDPEQAPGPHPFHTPVPYLLEGSVPYLCSIPLIYTLWYIYIIIDTYIYIWRICAVWFYICTRRLERTYIDKYVHVRIRLLCPNPVIVLARLCLQRLLCDGRDVLGCCWQPKNGLLVTGLPSQPVAGLRLHHLQLLPAVA